MKVRRKEGHPERRLKVFELSLDGEVLVSHAQVVRPRESSRWSVYLLAILSLFLIVPRLFAGKRRA